jgi:hypothetical protein
MSRKACASLDVEFRPLNKDEIERRIDTLAGELAADAVDRTTDNDGLRPRWIAARDLVRRMRPFIVLN